MDQHTYPGVDIFKDRCWDTHIAKAIGFLKSHTGKMDAMLTDSQLDTGNEMDILIVLNPRFAEEMCERFVKVVNQLETSAYDRS